MSIFNEEAINKQIEEYEQRLRDAFEAGWNAHEASISPGSGKWRRRVPRTDVDIAIEAGIRQPEPLSLLYVRQKSQV